MKRLIVIILVVIIIFCFTGCTANHLPEGITKEILLEHTTEIVILLNSREYMKVIEMYRDDSKEGLTVDIIANSLDTKLEALGDFKRVKEAIYSENTQTGDELVCIILCEFENGTMTCRVIYDDKLNVLGIYTL